MLSLLGIFCLVILLLRAWMSLFAFLLYLLLHFFNLNICLYPSLVFHQFLCRIFII
ncbi:uncharacterized protein DS421_2g51670 [Arachis hypogaea]|nr:uncharacterized protein DS421_2g51670 [Arachis hypogaea]